MQCNIMATAVLDEKKLTGFIRLWGEYSELQIIV